VDPPTRTSPCFLKDMCRPARRSRRVDFPAPDGPMMPTTLGIIITKKNDEREIAITSPGLAIPLHPSRMLLPPPMLAILPAWYATLSQQRTTPPTLHTRVSVVQGWQNRGPVVRPFPRAVVSCPEISVHNQHCYVKFRVMPRLLELVTSSSSSCVTSTSTYAPHRVTGGNPNPRVGAISP
jgi:hypothetical protein